MIELLNAGASEGEESKVRKMGAFEQAAFRAVARAHGVAQDIRDAALMRSLTQISQHLERGGWGWIMNKACRGLSVEQIKDMFS